MFTLQTSAPSRKNFLYVAWFGIFLVALALLLLWNEPLKRPFSRLEPLANALFIALTWVGLGFPLTRRLTSLPGRTITLLTSAAFGCGLTSLFVFLAGIAGYLTYWILLPWFLLGFFGFVICLFQTLLRPQRSVQEQQQDTSPWNVFAITALVVVLLTALPNFIAPEVSSDALSYHLLVPKIFISLQKIVSLPYIAEAHYPSLPEYNYIPALICFDEIACKALHLIVGLLTLVAIAYISNLIFVNGSSYLPAALFAATPAVAVELAWAWSDLYYTFFVLMTLLYLLFNVEPETTSDRNFIIAGIMAGLAGWSKYTFLLYAPVLLLLLLYGYRKWNWSGRNIQHFLIPVCLISAVWMVRNLWFTGNPFYPLLNNVFQSPLWTEHSDQFFKNHITRFYIADWNWYTYLIFPIQLMFLPKAIDTHVGILPLLLVPLLFRSHDARTQVLKLFVVGTFAFWMVAHTGVRTLFPCLAILFVIGAKELQVIFTQPKKRAAVLYCLGAALFANLLLLRVNIDHLFDPLRFFIGVETREQYLTRMAPSQQTFDYLNQSSRRGRVLLISMHNPLYLKREFFFSGRYDIPVAQSITSGSTTVSHLANKMREAEIIFVAVDLEAFKKEQAGGLYSWSAGEKRIFEDTLKTEFHPVRRFGDQLILAPLRQE